MCLYWVLSFAAAFLLSLLCGSLPVTVILSTVWWPASFCSPGLHSRGEAQLAVCSLALSVNPLSPVTIQNRPALIRTRQSTWIGPYQYWGERSPGNPRCRSVRFGTLTMILGRPNHVLAYRAC